MAADSPNKREPAVPRSISPFVFEGFPNDDWESATPPALMEAVLSVRSLGGAGFFRIDTLLKKEEAIRREPRPWISFGKCYKEREQEAQRAAREIFDKFLLIGTANRAIINASPVAWAYGQAEAQLHDEFRSTQSLQEFHKIKRWIKEYCDGRDQTELPAIGATEDWLRHLLRENWRAPLWLRVAVSRHFASDPSALADLTEQNALQRLDKEETETLLNWICRWFWSSVKAALENKARLESVNLATQTGVGMATREAHAETVLPGAMISGEVASARVAKTAISQEKEPSKGRPRSVAVATRRAVLRKLSGTGFEGEDYCKAVLNAGLSTPIDWQKRDGCPKSYLEAWNHPNKEKRKIFRQRISDEKYKATK